MRNQRRSSGLWPAAIAALLGIALVAAGCGRKPTPTSGGGKGSDSNPAPVVLPKVEPREGTAVVVLVDTSGSMEQSVPGADGKPRRKSDLARAALERLVGFTADWKQKNPDKVLQLGVLSFSSSVNTVLPMGDFDAGKARTAVGHIPAPSGNTAIGRALQEGYKSLYASGCRRKFVICITDGENTSGPLPEQVARQLYTQTEKEVEMHFIAFDTQASHFRFLKEVNGHAVEASDGPKLQVELARIYERRIILEQPLDEKQ